MQQNDNQRDYSVDELIGKIDYSKSDDFTLIPNIYTSKTGIYMRSDAYESFVAMHEKAEMDNINLTIISAARNFDYQKGIWERKWKDGKYAKYFGADKAKAIMKYSSMPGTSRHHWGTDIDINNLNDSYFTSGEGKKVYEWLIQNANDFGFHQTYTSKDSGRTGYEEEKWHWSYMPSAKGMLDEFNDKISYEEISGFNGSTNAESVKAIENYVNGIDSKLTVKE